MLYLFYILTFLVFLFVSILLPNSIAINFTIFVTLNVIFYGFLYMYFLINLTYFLKKEMPDVYKRNKGFSSYKGTFLLSPLALLMEKQLKNKDIKYLKELKISLLFLYFHFFISLIGSLILSILIINC